MIFTFKFLAVGLLLVFLLTNSGNCEENNPLIFNTRECFITEPLYGYKFNFSVLHSDMAHLATSNKGDIFSYNICGNLTRSCNGQNNVAACLRKGNNEYILGNQHDLNYRNGKIYFSFSNGGKCPTGVDVQFKLYVFVSCDYTLDKVQSKVTPYSNDACSFYITLETPEACLPEPDNVKSNCSVKDPSTGYTYDLLELGDVNYRTIDRMGSAFVINICKPVLYGENAMCPPGSSICFVSLKSTDFKEKFFDYGTVQSNLIIEKGQLQMRYSSNTACNSTDNYSSIIYFYCDMEVKNPHPELIGVHGCLYEFSFVTPRACNNLAPCMAIAHGNEILDMTPLMDKPFTLRMQDKNYTFAVCSSAGVPCLENDGSCITFNGESTSLGKFSTNSHLRYNQTGSPYLLYDGGATCQKSDHASNGSSSTLSTSTTSFWSTKIEFVCANNATKDNGATFDSSTDTEMLPIIIENTNCQLLIHYQTALACQEQIACKAKSPNEEMVDLSPLISAAGNYEAKIDSSSITEQQVPKSTKFFLNVCRPLVPIFGLGCPGGSAACMAKVSSTAATPEEEQSLGFPLASLVAINSTAAELRYYQGSSCPTEKNSQHSSSIEFYCDMRAGKGTPILKTVIDCHYQFIWHTNVLCPPHMCNFNPETCEIINDEINESYNLKKASFTDAGKIKIEMNTTTISIDACGALREPVTDYSQGLVNLFFTAKTPCGLDGLVNVQMRLICSSDNEGATFFSNDLQCNLVYIQRTPDICKFLGLSIPTKTTTSKPNENGSTESSNTGGGHPAEATGSIGTILAGILSITFFVACFGVFAFSPERRNSLRRLFRRSTSSVRYSRVQSNEEANLLLEPNGEFTDSDDEMLL